MTRRAAPLLIDRLPLYATDKELRAAIFGERSEKAVVETSYRNFTQMRGFPRFSPLLGGRHVPSVLLWFEEFEVEMKQPPPPDGNERESTWNAKGPRGRRAANSTGR